MPRMSLNGSLSENIRTASDVVEIVDEVQNQLGSSSFTASCSSSSSLSVFWNLA
jgi:hypothetical protein